MNSRIGPLFYAPFWGAGSGVTREASERAALLWLNNYPLGSGETRNVLLPTMATVVEGVVGPTASSRGWQISTPRSGGPGRGPVIAAWADQDMIERLCWRPTTGVCVIGWGEPVWFDALMSEAAAINVLTGQPHPKTGTPVLPALVEAGLIELGWRVNHANGLSGPADRRDAVEVFAALRDSGERWDTGAMWGWAIAHGFSGSEAARITEMSTKALDGKRFRGEPDKHRIRACLTRWQPIPTAPHPVWTAPGW